jgi:hypothetical protein
MFTAKKLSSGHKHHFFGYYGINPWDRALKNHLALETDFHDQRPDIGDTAIVGLLNRYNQVFTPYAQTSAFNLQQGSMMHWIDSGYGEEFTFNDWEGDGLVSRAVNPENHNIRTIQSAIAAISSARSIAIGLNYARMAHCRPVVGYANNIDPASIQDQPEGDGLFLIDLKSGESRLILSIAHVIGASNHKDARGKRVWFNHVVFNTDGARILFFCRYIQQGGLCSSLWTVNPDGTDLECQIPFRKWISHFDWRDEKRILISTNLLNDGGFLEFTDGKLDFRPFGASIFPKDGHACFSPDRRWIVCDYRTKRGNKCMAGLMLYDMANDRKIVLGEFRSDERFSGDIRCDLHPRWSHDGSIITFDSIHEGDRQIYSIDVSEIANSYI